MATCSYRGVEYEFVDTTKEDLEELKCSVCWQLVSDPQQTSCGHLFCRECIKEISTCALDRKEFTSHPDKFYDKKVRNFKVKCLNKERGCQWQGSLGEAEKHTDTKCDYQLVKCDTECCNVKLERRQLADHMHKECPQRMYQCPYCSTEDTYLKVITTHFTKCEHLPLPCPAGCGKRGLVRRDMAHHLSENCPSELVACKFAIAGCQLILKRKDLQQHLQDKDWHLDTVLSSYISQTLLVQDLLHRNTPNIPLPFCPWLQNMPTCYPRPQWVIKMEAFQEKKKNDEMWYSDPLYSHFGGYKMCFCVYANGQKTGKGTHVSVYICLMQGDNDYNLKWPFRGTIKASLLNQLEDGQHHTKQVWSPGSDIPDDTSGRVTEGERASRSWGLKDFIALEDLRYHAKKKCQYLKDDTLFFRVDRFEPKLD